LDYILVSPRILDFVDICGIEPFHQVIHSDHRGLFVDLDLQGILGGELASILPPKLRGVSSSTDDPSIYVLAVHKHLLANKTFQNSADILAAARTETTISPNLVVAVNKIDRIITQAMLLAEIRCRRKPRPAWSATLATASNIVKFWKTLISGLKNRRNVFAQLSTLGNTLKWDKYPPTLG
jgi:hypothetical protein